MHIRIAAVGARSIRYTAHVTKDGVAVATGSLTIACIAKQSGAPLRSTTIPPEIAGRFDGCAPPSGTMTSHHGDIPDTASMTGGSSDPPDSECQPRPILEARQAERLTDLLGSLRGRKRLLPPQARRRRRSREPVHGASGT